MGTLFAAGVEPGLVGLFSQFGFPVAMTCALLWYFYRRDARMADEIANREAKLGERIDELDQYIRTSLSTLTQESTRALVNNTSAMQQMLAGVASSNKRVGILISRLIERPCLLEKETVDTPNHSHDMPSK